MHLVACCNVTSTGAKYARVCMRVHVHVLRMAMHIIALCWCARVHV